MVEYQFTEMDALGKYSVQNLQKLCKIVCRCSVVYLYKNVLFYKTRHKFLVNCITSDNILCYICQNSAAHDLNMLH